MTLRRETATGTSGLTWERTLLCARYALEKKAYDLTVLYVGELTSVADYFLICTGRSDTQVQAIVQSVEENLKRKEIRPLSIEGLPGAQWVLMDYGDVLVHVFYQPVRAFYDLERLWSRAPRPPLPEPYSSQVESLRTGTD
jgi:ribosome-associated protein